MSDSDRKAENSAVASSASAQEAGLHYTSDSRPGLTRQRAPEGFQYFDARGKRVRDAKILARIRRMAVPPAWEEVWISADPRGHLQVTGRDARGRKQYRYHQNWRKVRDEAKYDRMIAFGRVLPKIRRRVSRDLLLRGLPRAKVLATIVRLLEMTLIRIGNDEYARDNRSYGLTTLRNRHADIRAATITFKFRGKSGKLHTLSVNNRRLARIVRRCRELPGYELFEYIDESGEFVDVTSTDVNEYLREIAGSDFTAKDFRTWAGTVLAARALQEFEKFASEGEAKRNMLRAIESVACMLGNTPAICRRCYVHPVILKTYLDGCLLKRLRGQAEQKLATRISNFRPEEAAVLMLLQQSLSRDSGAAPLRYPPEHSRTAYSRTPGKNGRRRGSGRMPLSDPQGNRRHP
jgi:DNA topoisomerase I